MEVVFLFFLFTFLISGHEKSVRERKRFFYTPGHNTRIPCYILVFVVFLNCGPRFLQIWEGEAAFSTGFFLVD